jgi:hypothetical protein
MIEITQWMVLAVLFAAVLAFVIWLYNNPSGPFEPKAMALNLAGMLIAAALTGWNSIEGGMDLVSFNGFVNLTVAAAGGWLTVGTIMGLAKGRAKE